MLYLLQLSLFWGIFALFYHLLLRKETFFEANRGYFLLTTLAGLLLPFVARSGFLLGETGVFQMSMPEVVVNIGHSVLQMGEEADGFSGMLVFKTIYFAGLVFTALKFCRGLFKVIRLARNGTKEYLHDGIVLIRTKKDQAPFSFFRQVFVAPGFQVDTSDGRAILAHEKAHAQGWHSADVLFFEMLCIVFWFHPLAYWYKNAARTVHEYIADAKTARITDRKQYGLLLIQQTQSGPAFALANHFYSSQLKKRIVMLTKKSSQPARSGWKYALVLPFMAFLTLLFNQDAAFAQVTESKNTLPIAEKAEPEPDSYPEFPGGMEALMAFMINTMKYPEDAKNAKAEGRLILKFIVDESGRITEVREAGFKGTRHESMVQEGFRVVFAMPKWKPALLDGKPVKCSFALPIMFKLN